MSKILPVCVNCLRAQQGDIEPYIRKAHGWRKELFGLPTSIPQEPNGAKCTICANQCSIPLNEQGYCGLRRNNNGQLEALVSPTEGLMHYYFDPHVTNCCGAYFCPAGTGVGYPETAYRPGPERGYANLAVFFYGCGFDCLFCQNVSHKKIKHGKLITSDTFLQVIRENQRISCICYFGGSPEPQLPFANRIIELCQTHFKKRILRQCFEMNGQGTPRLVKKMGRLVANTGGIVKFDLKAFSEPVHRALCGVTNKSILQNFAMLAEMLPFENQLYPPLMATTLLVPHYVDEFEVSQIAHFLKDLDRPSIEYSLLIFHPDHLMTDLPVTPLDQVQRCYDVVKKVLGKRPHIGNLGLLQGQLRL